MWVLCRFCVISQKGRVVCLWVWVSDRVPGWILNVSQSAAVSVSCPLGD